MTYRGTVTKSGKIQLDKRAALPAGTAVSVRPLKKKELARAKKPKRGERIPTLYERMKPFIGIAEGLPRDAALNHDHYLYGAPKKK